LHRGGTSLCAKTNARNRARAHSSCSSAMRRAAVGLLFAALGGWGCSHARIQDAKGRPPDVADSAIVDSATSADPLVIVDASADAPLAGDATGIETDRDDAALQHPVIVKGKARGAVCGGAHPRGGCALGLVCCVTDFRGHCGGAYMPGADSPPCVLISTCIRPPCEPMAMPP
jgi:hypothetical protein